MMLLILIKKKQTQVLIWIPVFKFDQGHAIESFREDWVTSLSWEDHASLGLFISFQLTKVLQKGETDAAELAGMIIGKSEQTIRKWRAHFLETNDLPKSNLGHYQRTGVL